MTEVHNDTESAILQDKVKRLRQAIYQQKPILGEVLGVENVAIEQFYTKFHEDSPKETIQTREDYINIVSEETSALLGSEIGEKMRIRLEKSSAITTAHHLAIDFTPSTVQGSIVASLMEDHDSVIPIFACGAVPADNVLHPLGPTIARERSNPTGNKTEEGKDITKVSRIGFNVISRAYKHTAVSALPSFNESQVKGALTQLMGYDARKGEQILYKEQQALKKIYEEVYLNPNVLNKKTYSEQVTVANNLLFKMLFSEDLRNQIPEMVYLEDEKIVSRVLQQDLKNQDSLVYRILFDPKLRNIVVKKLNGVPGCWNLNNENETTFLFWGLDGKNNRLIKIGLAGTDNHLALTGANLEDIPFTPNGLSRALQDKRLIPATFMSFVTHVFARGMKAYGGYFQTDYLTQIKEGLIVSLVEGSYKTWAELISKVPTKNYLCGSEPIMVRYADDTVKPAGPVEIVAKGGLTIEDYQKLNKMSVQTANSVAYPNIYRVVSPIAEQDPDLLSVTREDLVAKHKGELIEISFKPTSNKRKK